MVSKVVKISLIQWSRVTSECVDRLVPVAETDSSGELGTSGTVGGKSEKDVSDGDRGY